jgi:hypothetical protein
VYTECHLGTLCPRVNVPSPEQLVHRGPKLGRTIEHVPTDAVVYFELDLCVGVERVVVDLPARGLA